ncbi:MAG TPA: hypothetical protein PKA41_07500 [Verrucomicrobiota bacterium]|nr:hypothetical protein [Verrucomicrobiota bacterium]
MNRTATGHRSQQAATNSPLQTDRTIFSFRACCGRGPSALQFKERVKVRGKTPAILKLATSLLNPRWSGSSNSVAASNREGARASARFDVDLQVDDEAA